MRLTVPVVGEEELEAIRHVLTSGFLTQGPRAAEFEAAVTRLTGSRHGFATSSCTTALHLALVAMDIGPGDEVVVPDFTFPATANVVLQQGAKPVVADIDGVSFAMDAKSFENLVTDRTRAVIPVHPFGLMADMDPLIEIARRHGVIILEDAACALGGTYRGRAAGTVGDLGAFSFHPRKIITTGEGGMVVTDRDDLADRMRVLRTHGSVRGDEGLKFETLGFNYRLSDINAAMGIVQMTRLDDILARRREGALDLTRLLKRLPEVTPPTQPDWAEHTYQSYVVLLPPDVARRDVVAAMAAGGIETTLGTYSLQSQPFFQSIDSAMRSDAVVSKSVAKRAMTLPLYPSQTHDDRIRIVEALERALQRSSKRT